MAVINRVKKALSLLLVLVMLMGMLPIDALAADSSTGAGTTLPAGESAASAAPAASTAKDEKTGSTDSAPAAGAKTVAAAVAAVVSATVASPAVDSENGNSTSSPADSAEKSAEAAAAPEASSASDSENKNSASAPADGAETPAEAAPAPEAASSSDGENENSASAPADGAETPADAALASTDSPAPAEENGDAASAPASEAELENEEGEDSLSSDELAVSEVSLLNDEAPAAGRSYSIGDMYNFNFSMSVNSTPYTRGMELVDGDAISIQLSWMLPSSGSYTSADEFVYDMTAILDIIQIQDMPTRTYVNSDNVECATYSIQDGVLRLHYTDAFLAGSDRFARIGLDGTVEIVTTEQTITGHAVYELPGGLDIDVNVRTSSGLSIDKAAAKRVVQDINGTHEVWVDYTVTVTANADNTNVNLKDTLELHIPYNDRKLWITAPSATLNGAPYDLGALTFNPNESHILAAQVPVINKTGFSLNKDDVLVITYSARSTEPATESDTPGYSDTRLLNKASVSSDQCNQLNDETDTFLTCCWIRKEGKSDTETGKVNWIITVKRGEYSNLTIKDTPVVNITAADDTVVTVYLGNNNNSLTGATKVGTTTWGQLKSGYSMQWPEGDNRYALLSFESDIGENRNFTNTASIEQPNKSHTASISIYGRDDKTSGTKTLLSTAFQNPSMSASPSEHYTLNLRSLIEIKIGQQAVDLGSDFYFIDQTHSNQNNNYHYFDNSPVESIRNEDGTDCTDLFTWEVTKTPGNFNGYTLTFRFKDGTPVPGRYSIIVKTKLQAPGGLGSASSTTTSNNLRWIQSVGQLSPADQNNTYWKYPTYMGAAKKTVVSSTSSGSGPNQLVWKINLPSLSFTFGSGSNGLTETYPYSTIEDTLPAGLKFESAYWASDKASAEPIDETPTKLSNGSTKLVFNARSNDSLYIVTSYDGDYLSLTAPKTYKNTCNVLLRTEKNGPSTATYPARFTNLSAEGTIQPPKFVSKSMGEYTSAGAPFIDYTLTVNSEGAKILSDELGITSFTLKDEMGSALVYEPNTMTINGVPLAGSGISISYANGGHTFILSGLQDETAYLIRYSARVLLSPGEILDSENSANTVTLPDIPYETSETVSFKRATTVLSPGDEFENAVYKVRVLKSDDRTPAQPVKGAVFTIYSYGTDTTPTADGTFVQTLTTDESGFTPLSGNLSYGVIYGIRETGVPDGYGDLTDGKVTYFVHKAADSTAEYSSDIMDVTAEATVQFSVTNHYKQGDLRVTKTVAGEGGDTDCPFSFTVTLSDTSVNGSFGDMTFTNGVAAFTLKHGESATAVNLPGDLTYSVTETPVAGYVTTSTGADGTIEDGKTGNDAPTAAFTNTYNVAPVSVQFSGIKTLNGKQLEAEEYSFVLAETIDGTDTEIETTKNDADGNYSFTAIDYKLPGSHTYTVKETNAGDSHVEYDTTVYTITVEVALGDDGKLTAKVSAVDGEGNAATETALNFENTYTPDTVSVTVEKKWADDELNGLTGYTRPDSVTFTLVGKVGDTVVYPAAGDPSVTATANAEGSWKATFSNLPKFSGSTEIEYFVHEADTDVPIGFTASATEDTPVTAVINGTVQVTNTPETEVGYGSVDLSVLKTDANTDNGLSGAVFTVKKGSTVLGDTAPTDENGKTGYSFTEPGTYTIVEKTPPTGYQLNETEFTVTVTVGDFIEVRYDSKKNAYVKVYALNVDTGSNTMVNGSLKVTDEPAYIDITAKKQWNDNDNQDSLRDSFAFTLYAKYADGSDAAVTIPEATRTLGAAETECTWTQLPQYADGKEVIYSVKETTVPTGYTSSTDTAAAAVTKNTDGKWEVTITNSHTPDLVSVTVEKKWADDALTGIPGYTRPTSVTFTLVGKAGDTVVYPAAGASSVTAVADADGSWKATFSNLPKRSGGTEIEYFVYEADTDVPFGFTADATEGTPVTAVINGTVQITNTPDTVSITAKKVWDDSDNAAGARGSFAFTLSSEPKFTIPNATKTLGAAETECTWSNLPRYVNDTEIRYFVAESTVPAQYYSSTADGASEVTFSSAGEGQVEITNRYITPITVQFSGKKTLESKNLSADMFSFVLTETTPDAADPISETVKNDADGKFKFSEITYTAAGTYTYTVAEKNDGAERVNYDSTVYTVTVEVTCTDGVLDKTVTVDVAGASETTLDFKNEYTPVPVKAQFGGKKTLVGKALAADEYSFILTETTAGATDPISETVKNNGSGDFLFTEIEYTKPGTYTYTVKELTGTDTHVTYDTAEYSITVTVTNNDGVLEKAVSVDISGVTETTLAFSNSYTPDPIEVSLRGTKKLTGRSLTDSEFSFTLTETTDGSSYSETVKNNASGAVVFTSLTFDAPGVHTYTVKEEPGSEPGMEYDSHEYAVTVTVTHNTVQGVLEAEITVDDKASDGTKLDFLNHFANGGLTISKTVTGNRGDTEKFFTFTVELRIDGVYSYTGSKTGTISSGGTILLKHNEYVTITGIPAGCTYKVTESGNSGYRVKRIGNTGTIADGNTSICTFTNSRSTVPGTGETDTLPMWFALMGSALTGMFASLFLRRRRKQK